MDKKNININGFKNVLVTKDEKSSFGDNVLKVKNYFFTRNLSKESKKEGYNLNLKFNTDDIDCDVDNIYYDAIEMSDSPNVYKEWKYDMYFEYGGCMYNAPLHKLFKNKGGFQSKIFVGIITLLDGVEHSLEVENYRQTIKSIGEK